MSFASIKSNNTIIGLSITASLLNARNLLSFVYTLSFLSLILLKSLSVMKIASPLALVKFVLTSCPSMYKVKFVFVIGV